MYPENLKDILRRLIGMNNVMYKQIACITHQEAWEECIDEIAHEQAENEEEGR